MRLSAVRCVQAAKMTARTNNTGHKKGVTLRPYVTLHPTMPHLARGPSSVSGAGRRSRLKILHVVGTPGHGSGRQVINLAENMRDLGHELHIIYSGTRISPDFRRQLDGLSNVQQCDVTMSRNPHPTDLKSTFRIRSYIYRNGPFDVVHGHSSQSGALARVAAIGSSAVRVYTPHAFVTMDPLLQRRERRVYRRGGEVMGWGAEGVIVGWGGGRREGGVFG